MVKNITLKNRAIVKMVKVIESCETYEHLAGAKRMINFLYSYKVRPTTMTYIMLKYRSKHREIHNG